MLFLVILALVGICSCEGEVSFPTNFSDFTTTGKVNLDVLQYNYHAEQDNVTLTSLPGNAFIRLADFESGYPTGIEYLADINPDTGLMVRMLFGMDDYGSLGPENDTRMNICDVLDKAIDDPDSLPAQYNIAESLGLTTTRCPILTGIKVLAPYEFPTDFTSSNISCGPSYYRMRVETANQGLDTEAIMELRVALTLTTNDDPCPESSSSKLLMPSIISSFAIGLIFFQLNN